ncbi:MAG: alpha/beta hydrolase [bacterium]|nr:alpha/beta hydrolase [bacterium]
MSSIRGKFVRRMMKFQPDLGKFSFEKQRNMITFMTKYLSGPKSNTYQEATIGDIPVLWVTPPAPSQQVMIYFHGGAYTIGSHQTERVIAGAIAAQSGAKLLLPHYRLAPEHPFPAGLEDALACYRQVVASGISPQNIIVGGISAGGGLTIALMLKLKELGEPLPKACVLVSAWLDLTGTAPSIIENARYDSGISWQTLIPSISAYAGDIDIRHPMISPVFADLAGLPPVLIQVGDIEILRDDSLQFAEKAQKAGCQVKVSIWRGMIHGWHMYRIIPEARQATDEIVSFILAHRG